MPDRFTLSRAEGYRKPDDAITVTRATIFGNPWQVGDPGIFRWPNPDRAGWQASLPFHCALDTAAVVRFYRDWLRTGYAPFPASLSRKVEDALWEDMAARRALILSRLPELRGRDLCCTCKPGQPCHANPIMELANA